MADPKKPKRVKFASTTEVEYLSMWLEEVLEAFGAVVGCKPLFVSDLSAIGEILEEGQAEAIGKELGIPVKDEDLFIEVAKRLKKARE